ncbi:thioester domain-containing protein [Streptomyces avicenniae]|uniref:thioester domain-containing protein n=1 Tax=Streptomyces avicenniae TaxID=500153 RepID=UPI00069BFC4F|nr:thioester domain-containing protein [Streptomyces avicenniae]
MNLARKRAFTRLAASAVATGLLTAGTFATATSATADDGPGQPGGATATLGGLVVHGSIDVTTADGETRGVEGGLFEMTSDSGSTLQTYCIDLFTGTVADARYQEVDWDASKLHDNEDAGRIQWVLQNAFPTVSAADLAAQAGVGELGDSQAAAATQAAIWELSDGVDAEPRDDVAAEVTDWLLANAVDAEEPGASLALAPDTVSGEAGSLVGPVTVSTTADAVSVVLDPAATAAGLTLVDADGAPLSPEGVTDGQELWFSVPEGAGDGSGGVTATATSTVPIGRVFTGIATTTQTMILAGTENTSVEARAGVTWTEASVAPVAVSFAERCAEEGGGIEVSITNHGDEPRSFVVGDQTVDLGPGEESGPVWVPAAEDTETTVQVTGADGTVHGEYTVTLDCEPTQSETPAAPPAGETPGGETPQDGNTPAPAGDSEDLAETGGGTDPVLFGGIAVALLVVGGAVVFLVRRRGAGNGD